MPPRASYSLNSDDSPVPDVNDSDLLRRHAKGDTAAFGELYQKYFRRVFGYCYRLLQDREAVADIVQTVFVRALESATKNGQLEPGFGDTDLFITPGYQFKSVDAMLTNFHLPESTLLMLVSAFAGYDSIMNAYQHAIDQTYRFFSYGDAMFLSR